MRPAWWLAVTLFACGDVNKVPDAAVPDAFAPDSPSELTCGPGEMACGGTCADVMTSELYCGNCNTQCAPNQGCAAGTCVPNFTACARILEIDPMAGDGVYTNPNSGAFFYCDMANKTQYNSLSLALWAASPPTGYVMVRSTDLTNPVSAKALVALYNRGNGVPTIASFTIQNCCLKIAAATYLLLDGNYVLPYVCAATMDGTYRFTELGTVAPQPLPDDFFTTNVASEATHPSCNDNTNPMWIWQKKTF